MNRIDKTIIPEPLYPIGTIVYDHWEGQYLECTQIPYVVVRIDWSPRTKKLEYGLIRKDELDSNDRCLYVDEYAEDDLKTYPREI